MENSSLLMVLDVINHVGLIGRSPALEIPNTFQQCGLLNVIYASKPLLDDILMT